MRRNPRNADVNRSSPRAWGTCERCGFVWNLHKLGWQFDWRGTQLANTRHLVCPNCMDKPQRQLGTIILPPDPLPVLNARPEQYSFDEEPNSARLTQNDKLRMATGYPAVSWPLRVVSKRPTPIVPTPIHPPTPPAPSAPHGFIDDSGDTSFIDDLGNTSFTDDSGH